MRFLRPLSIVGLVASSCALIVAGSLRAQGPLPPQHQRRTQQGAAFQLKQLHVEQGTADAARKYYREVVSPQMAFLTADTIERSSIREMLDYFGYSTVQARDLHALSSVELMKASSLGDILATRFFAPKITDVADVPPKLPASGYGWRKLIRFRPKAGSAAVAAGMSALIVLQNQFSKDESAEPFDIETNVPLFNQAIVTRAAGPFGPVRHPLYFLTYGRLVKTDANGIPTKENGQFQSDGPLTLSLEATFDEDDRDPETNLKPKEYFVPDACVQCHGGTRTRTKLNFLDTDHWFDRVTPQYGVQEAGFAQEDFTGLAASPHGILYDGGTDLTSSRFKEAFEVIRQINKEFRDQNALLGPLNNFQLQAADKWLELHEPARFDIRRAPPYERGIGTTSWEPTNADHRKILYFLNRYCYRCHSSVRFSVFDRAAVTQKAGEMIDRIKDTSTAEFWMPQDRIFPGLTVDPVSGETVPTGDMKTFIELLGKLTVK